MDNSHKKHDQFEDSLLRLASESNPGKVLELVAETAALLIDAETLAVPTLSPDNLEVRYDYAYGKHKSVFLSLSFPIEDAGLCGWVLENRLPILTNNLQEDPRVKKEMAKALGITSALLVPLIARGKIIGGLAAFNKKAGSTFTEEDSAFLTRLASYAAITIDNARLMEALGLEKLKLEAILNSVREGIVFLKKDGTIVNVNKAMELYFPMKVEEMTGTNIREFSSIKPLAALFDWEARAQPGKRCWEVLNCKNTSCPEYGMDFLRCWSFSGGHCHKAEFESREDEKTWELCAHCKVLAEAYKALAAPREAHLMGRTLQATSVLAVSSAIVVEEASKDIFGEVMVFRDVSADRRIELQRNEFVSMITHDLKTPITSIMGYCELMLEEEEPAKIKEMVRAALQNSKKLLKMISDFLDLSKAEAGKTALNLISVSPRSFLSSLHQQFQAQAVEKGVNLSWEVEEGAPEIMADIDQLSRIVGNLVSNGLKYVSEGGNIKVRAFSSDKGFAAITVEDDGPGIDPEELPRVFDAYYSGKNHKKAESSGLGLAIVKVLTEAHGGTVSVKSVKGKGSAFTVFLPASAKGKDPRGPGQVKGA